MTITTHITNNINTLFNDVTFIAYNTTTQPRHLERLLVYHL